MSEPVLVTTADGVATITLNRPEKRNAINGALRRGLHQAMDDLEADDSIAAMILTGTDPAFCAGLDLRELGSRSGDVGGAVDRETGDQGAGDRDRTVQSVKPFPARTKPLIGAINGAAITGGFEFALNCDFLIASERAVFADTHARVGVMPGWGLSALLADAVGVRRAREISLTGNFVTAEEALTWGLVNRVVAHDDLLPTVQRIAADIAGNDPPSVGRMLATYREQEDADRAEAWRIEGAAATEFRRRVGFDPDEVERRRQGIIDRGRTQV